MKLIYITLLARNIMNKVDLMLGVIIYSKSFYFNYIK